MGATRRCCVRPWVLVAAGLITIAGQADAGRPALRDAPVVWYENDRIPVAQPKKRAPNLWWDYIEDSVVLPRERATNPVRLVRHVGSVFGGDHVLPAANVNTLDEVPNSTWFTNRIGLFPLSPETVARGPGRGTGPDRSRPWKVVRAKTEGVTPGFNIEDARGDVYLIKFDPPEFLGMTTGAGVVSNRILYAAGYNTPEDAVVIFERADVVVGENVTIAGKGGVQKRMTETDLDDLLGRAKRLPDGRWLAISSKFLDGKPIGPFDYHGRRDDDPNDHVDHEQRRELRGLQVFAAWLNHFDTKQHNSLDMFVAGGYVKHYLIDFASTLGSGALGPTPMEGKEYTVDYSAMLGRLLTLGLREDPWRRRSRPDGLDEVGFFESEGFDPTRFNSLQPNSAFANLTDRDGYWAAKIIAAFSDEALDAVVAEAHYQDPAAERHIARVLRERRDIIARHYFDRVAPLDFFTLRDGVLRFVDLGAKYAVYPGTTERYRVRCAAVDHNRAAASRTPWRMLEGTEVRLDAPDVQTVLDEVRAATRPFVSVEVQVDRGAGWSQSVTAYVSRAGARVVAVDR